MCLKKLQAGCFDFLESSTHPACLLFTLMLELYEYFKCVLKPNLSCILAKTFVSFLSSKRQHKGASLEEPGTRQPLCFSTDSDSGF